MHLHHARTKQGNIEKLQHLNMCVGKVIGPILSYNDLTAIFKHEFSFYLKQKKQ